MNSLSDAPLGFMPLELDIPRFYSMQGEDLNYARKYWINRKADRFTLSVSYMRSGWTKANKQWFQWEQAFAVSVSARKLKNGTQTVNLYANNRIGYMKLLRNFTSNPQVVQSIVGDEVLQQIVTEMEMLAARQGFLSEKEILKHRGKLSIGLQFAELLNFMAYPMAQSMYAPKDKNRIFPTSYEKGIPLYLSPYLRMNDADAVAKSLRLGTKATKIFTENLSSLPSETIYILELFAGFATDETQTTILNDILNNKESHYIKLLWEIDNRRVYTPYIRQILRTVPKASLQKIMTSRFFYDDMSQSLQTWVGLSKYEKNFKLSEPVHELREALVNIQDEVRNRKRSQFVDEKEFLSIVKLINDGRHVKVSNSSNYFEIWLGSLQVILNTGLRNTDSSFRGRIRNINHSSALNMSHPLWKKIKKNEHFIHNGIDLAGYSHSRELPAAPQGSGGSFSPKLYLEFLKELIQEAEARLNKYGIPITVDSRAFAFSTVVLELMKQRDKRWYKTPRKVFQLYKLGVDSDIIYQAVTYNMPFKAMAQYAGIPADWVQNIYGWSSISRNAYDF